uniref:Transgelin n=1 Tax=Sinocyclocheilus rhinocerous TaxID=307959 RepID=A0A673H472_9TELE
MANKGPSYGMSRQVQDKIEQKYDPELEVRLVEWIVTQCGSGVGKPEAGKLGFQTWLKDGCVSHACVVLSRQSCKVTIQLEQMQESLRTVSLLDPKTVKIYVHLHRKDLAAVQRTLMALGSIAVTKDEGSFRGDPSWFFKKAQENRRGFSEGQLKEGKNVIGLQMGSNKGATQSGMTGYGRPRQIMNP